MRQSFDKLHEDVAQINNKHIWGIVRETTIVLGPGHLESSESMNNSITTKTANERLLI
jgi:hypothetical protein